MKKTAGLLIAAMLLSGCMWEEIPPAEERASAATERPVETTTPAATEKTTTAAPETTAAQTEPPPPPDPEVTIVCAGDNLIHTPIFRQAAQRTDGNGYDFLPAYEATADIVAAADLAILNQETILSDEFEPSNYPRFCSPTALGDDMVKLGFDAFSICNNHVLDKGEKGLRSTLSYWKEKQPRAILYGASLKDEDKIAVAEINGVTFAFVGFMEHTNGLYLPNETDCKITYLSDKEEAERQVRAARELADCVIVSVHYGIEVSNIVTQAQLNVTRELADWGADIIIGTQPHTVQQMEYVEKADGGRAFVFYCLGNYISAMDNPISMVGYLGRLKVTKSLETREITISEPEAIPVITHYTKGCGNIRVIPWESYTPELAAVHGCAGFSYSLAEGLIEKYVKYEDLLD